MFQRDINSLLSQHSNVPGLSLTIIDGFEVKPHAFGLARVSNHEEMTAQHFLQCASLSKTVATAFAIEYFAKKNISMMTTSVNSLLEAYNAKWKIEVSPSSNLPRQAANQVTLAMLVNHTALGMHYVWGIPLDKYIPPPYGLISGDYSKEYRYERLFLERVPGSSFSYSGGGYVVLQYLIELMENGKSIDIITRDFLDSCGLKEFTFLQQSPPWPGVHYATGHVKLTQEVNPPLAFPPFAAGALCTPRALSNFLVHLSLAYHRKEGSGAISHQTARLMLDESSCVDLGALQFMGAKMGLGVFIAQAGNNKIMLHQAANDGFRGVYMVCFEGDDVGKGFVILTNGDNPAVLLQSELCRYLLGPQGKGIEFPSGI